MFDRELHLTLVTIEIDKLLKKLNELYADKPEFINLFSILKANIEKILNQKSFEEAFEIYEKVLRIDTKKEGLISPITYKLSLTMTLLVEYSLQLKFEREQADTFSAITHLIGVSRQMISNLEFRDAIIKHKKPTGRSPRKHQAQKRAKEIVREIWADDLEQSIRTTQMLNKLYGQLVVEGFKDTLPEISTLKRWVQEFTPEYAKKGGRPNK